MPNTFTEADLDNWFSYHAPTPEQVERYKRVREAARAFAGVIGNEMPACADATVAMRKLRETVMAVNQAIACNEKVPP